MKTREYLKARTIVEQDKIRLDFAQLDAERPLFIFLIDNDIIVSYNKKGWLCDSISGDWSSSFNKGKICYRIMAAQLYIKKNNLVQEWMEGVDFKFALTR